MDQKSKVTGPDIRGAELVVIANAVDLNDRELSRSWSCNSSNVRRRAHFGAVQYGGARGKLIRL